VLSSRIDRRGLFKVGAVAVVTVAGVQVLDPLADADAAELPDYLRRSVWNGLADRRLQLVTDAGTTAFQLVDIGDLPIAASIPALRGHDGAFVLHFSGPAGTDGGTRTLRSDAIGEMQLALSPVERAEPTQLYEAIVDRTVRITGVNEEGSPAPVADPGPRGEQPGGGESGAAAGGAAAAHNAKPGAALRHANAHKPPRPGLRHVTLSRRGREHVAVAELALIRAEAVRVVHAQLLSDGRVLSSASAHVRGGRSARLRFAARGDHAFAARRYELRLTFVAHDGRTTVLHTQAHAA
jgi:hypothetical protein